VPKIRITNLHDNHTPSHVLESLNNINKASSSGSIECKTHTNNMRRRIVNALLKDFRDTVWTFLGNLWETFVDMFVGHLLDTFGTLVGYLLDTCLRYV
jgi:hypothetical protein